MEPEGNSDAASNIREALAKVHRTLSEHGIDPGMHGYDADYLTDAMEARGWNVERVGDIEGASSRFVLTKRRAETDRQIAFTKDESFELGVKSERSEEWNGLDPDAVALAVALKHAIELDDEHERSMVPRLRNLIRTVPINRGVARGGAMIWLMSLESYDDGFVVRSRLHAETSHPFWEEHTRSLVRFHRDMERAWKCSNDEEKRRRSQEAIEASRSLAHVIVARDNLGHHYQHRQRDFCGLRSSEGCPHDFWPRLDLNARELTIEITLGLKRARAPEDEPPDLLADAEPWRFVIDLTGDAVSHDDRFDDGRR